MMSVGCERDIPPGCHNILQCRDDLRRRFAIQALGDDDVGLETRIPGHQQGPRFKGRGRYVGVKDDR
jgi:hypothetical protein